MYDTYVINVILTSVLVCRLTMAKTIAEIQQAYRERQKAQKISKFLQKERLRVKKYYTPAKKLSKKNLKAKNFQNMLRNRLSRQRRKELLEATQQELESGYATGELTANTDTDDG